MAKSIAKAILRDTSKHNKPGGRASGSFPVKYRKSGNQRTFGSQKQGTRQGSKGSINTGGNYGPLGHSS